jgi:hypothetical protein
VQSLAHRVWRLEGQLSELVRDRGILADGDEASKRTAADDVAGGASCDMPWPRPCSTSRRRRDAARRNATAAEPMAASAAVPGVVT